MRTKLSKASLMGATTLLAATLVYAMPTSSVTIDGEIHTHDGGSATGITGTEGTVDHPDESIPLYTYVPPVVPGTGISSNELSNFTINADGVGTTKVLRYEGDVNGNSTVNPTGAATMTIKGGGTVIIHIPGDLTFNGNTVEIEDGTQVVLMVDGDVLFDFATITQTGGGLLSIEAGGDVVIRTPVFRGAAFANNNLTFNMSNGGDLTDTVILDASLLNMPALSEAKTLRMLPIVEGK